MVKPSVARVAPSGMAATASSTLTTLMACAPAAPASKHVAAAHVDDLAGHVAGLIRRQESDHRGHVLGPPCPSQGNPLQLLFADGLGDVSGHRGVDEAGTYGVDRHLAAGQLAGGGSAETDDARLGGGIVGLTDVAHPACRG